MQVHIGIQQDRQQMVNASAKKRQKAKATAAAQRAGTSETTPGDSAITKAAYTSASAANAGLLGITGQHDKNAKQHDGPESQHQGQQSQLAHPNTQLPKVSISSLKRTASPGPEASQVDASNTAATALGQIGSNRGTANGDADGRTATSQAAAKRLKSPPTHDSSPDANAITMAAIDKHTPSDTPDMQTPQEDTFNEHLAQQLAGAPGPAMKNRGQPGQHPKSFMSYTSSAPTPTHSPAKPRLPDSSDAELADIRKAAAILKQSALSAQAAAFHPSACSSQYNDEQIYDPSASTHLGSPASHGSTGTPALAPAEAGLIKEANQLGSVPKSHKDRELPQRSKQTRFKRQDMQRREAGKSRLSRTTFTESDNCFTTQAGLAQQAGPENDAAEYSTSGHAHQQLHDSAANAPAIDAESVPPGHASSGAASIISTELSTIAKPPNPAYQADLVHDDSASPHSAYSSSNTFSADPIHVLRPNVMTHMYAQPSANDVSEGMGPGYGISQISAMPVAQQWLVCPFSLDMVICHILMPCESSVYRHADEGRHCHAILQVR